MIYQVAICDDNEQDIKPVLSYLKIYEERHAGAFSFKTDIYTSPDSLLNQPQLEFDLYLLDILMDGMDGISLADAIRTRCLASGVQPCIVFLTSSRDFAFSAFSVYASGYLLKPVSMDEFFNLLTIISSQMEARRLSGRQYFSFRTVNGVYNTLIDDILYVEIMGHTPFFHFKKTTVRASDLRVAFSKSMLPLLDTGHFLFPHRAYIVNARHVTRLGIQELILDNVDCIPIARSRLSETKSQYMDFLMEDNNHV